MRPTIPLSAWRIAVDLEATTRIQRQPGLPAVGCGCVGCVAWSRQWSSLLPEALIAQLQRLRIDVAHPSDLYAFEETRRGVNCRVIFHVVGRLLSGPVAWRDDAALGRRLVYHALSGPSGELLLVVVPSSQTFEARPQVEGLAGGELLQIDFRLCVPFAAAMAPARDMGRTHGH